MKTIPSIDRVYNKDVQKTKKKDLQKATMVKPDLEMIGIINKRGRMTESLGFDSLSMPK